MRSFIVTVLCLLCTVSYAQEEPSRKDITGYIGYFENNKDITFAYDAELLKQLTTPIELNELSLGEFIEKAQAQLPIIVTKINDAYYTLKLIETDYLVQIGSTEKKQPIPYELGIMILVNGQPISVSQDNSNVAFSYKPSNQDTLEVYVPGFQRKQIDFQTLLTSRNIGIKLNPNITELAGVTIEDYLTSGIDMNPSNQSISIDVTDLPLLPGETDGDLFASIVALPGITTPDNRPGNLFIRGSSTDQSLILFEDIPIYHRGHYYGTISPYNPKVIDDVKVYRNGFHPRLGGRVGGAIEINSSDVPKANAQSGIGSNTLYGMAYTKLPLASGKLSLSVGARRSYPVSFQSPKLQSISDMVFAGSAVEDSSGTVSEEGLEVLFEDYHGKLSWEASKNHLFSLTSIYTQSVADYFVGALDSIPEQNRIANLGINASWQYKVNEKMTSNLSLTSSDYQLEFKSNEAIENTSPNVRGIYSINGIRDLGIVEELSFLLPENNALQLGLDYKFQQTDYQYKGDLRQQEVFLQGKVNSHTLSPFLNFEWNSLEKLYVQLGLRGTYYEHLDEFQIAPRLFLNYFANNKVTLKGSYGKYYQYLSQIQNLEFSSGGFDNGLWLLADARQKIMRGDQSMVGAILNLDSWIIDFEGYYKEANNVTYSQRRFSNNSSFTQADHTLYGLDLFIKKKVNESLTVWTGYSRSESKIAFDTAQSITYDSKYNQPHVFYLGGSFVKGQWKISGGWRYSSGLVAYSLYVIETELSYERNTARRPPPPGGMGPPPDPFRDVPYRYPNVHMLDLSASYKIPKTDVRKWSATFGLSLINVYNQNNLTDQVIRIGQPEPIPTFMDREAISFAPNLMLIFEW